MTKSLKYLSIIPSLIYSALMLINRTPTISDAIIVVSLITLSIFIQYIEFKKSIIFINNNETEEVKKLKYEIELKKLNEQLDFINYQSNTLKARRDQENVSGIRRDSMGMFMG